MSLYDVMIINSLHLFIISFKTLSEPTTDNNKKKVDTCGEVPLLVALV